MANGSVEIDMQPLGDFSLTPQGDLVLAIDTIDVFPATIERLQRLILTSPILYNATRQPIGRPDDLFHPTYGAGVPAQVGDPVTTQLLASIQSQILKGIAADPSIATNPAPIVTVSDLSTISRSYFGYVQISVTVTTVTGQLVTVPSLTLQPLGTIA